MFLKGRHHHPISSVKKKKNYNKRKKKMRIYKKCLSNIFKIKENRNKNKKKRKIDLAGGRCLDHCRWDEAVRRCGGRFGKVRR
jgi:hypothetical protein